MIDLRSKVLGDQALPDVSELIQQGREQAAYWTVGSCAFLEHYGVSSEFEYKENSILQGRVMRHAQIGYRSIQKTCTAYREIFEHLQLQGCTVDRYGICLDWSMGYPQDERPTRPTGTGLILDSCDSYAQLTAQAPVAPHFGDFVMGMPAAFDNTSAALSAGATSIGNLGQYFTFRLPGWDDDVATTAETIKAIALCAAQPVPVLIHSNLDDGFAALFTDLACALGAVLLEQHIVDGLLGARSSHCYGHTYSEPLARLAFQRALAEVSKTPGTMVYGNTTLYGSEATPNYAGLGSYLLIDALAQMLRPSGHAVNPVPVTEARRIPDIEEIVDAHLFADRSIERARGFTSLIDIEHVDEAAAKIVSGAKQFKDNILAGFEKGGIDIRNPLEMLLSIRRLGARYLERYFGPGKADPGNPAGRKPVFLASTISELERQASTCIDALSDEQKYYLGNQDLKICVATTDVHEYGKLLLENVFTRLGISTVDGGVCTDPEDLVARFQTEQADIIAISTYNGIALDYLHNLQTELLKTGLQNTRIYIGGKLNQITDSDSPTHDDLPVDVSQQLLAAGATPCPGIEDMLLDLCTAPSRITVESARRHSPLENPAGD